MMRAVVLDAHGGVEVLVVQEVDAPTPGPEEVLVDVVATALNRADLLQRKGFYPGPPMAREIPGMEFCGRVNRLGDRVSEWTIGDEVMGIVGGGAYAEQLVVHERQVSPVPRSVTLADAAAIPEVFITAFDALVRQGELRSGGRALIHAGASGVGSAGIQIAKAWGAAVAVTTSTSKVQACADIGADLVVDYTVGDFVPAIAEWSNSVGVDVVLDVVGGDYVDRNIDCVRVGGRIVQVGVMGGGRSEVSIGKLLPKRASLIGTVLRSRPLEEKIEVTQDFIRQMLPRFEHNQLRPIIDRRFDLADIALAHTYMESNANIGKILIDVQQ